MESKDRMRALNLIGPALRAAARTRWELEIVDKIDISIDAHPRSLSQRITLQYRQLQFVMHVPDEALMDINFMTSTIPRDIFARMHFAEKLDAETTRSIKQIESVLETAKLRLLFHNGHYIDVDNSETLSDFDRANITMIHDLPPL